MQHWLDEAFNSSRPCCVLQPWTTCWCVNWSDLGLRLLCLFAGLASIFARRASTLLVVLLSSSRVDFELASVKEFALVDQLVLAQLFLLNCLRPMEMRRQRRTPMQG